MDNLAFLKTEFPKLVSRLSPEMKGTWGVLNAQQMVEHMADSVRIATGKDNQSLHTPAEHLEKYKAFAMSDKEFKPNTKNALMDETPPAIRHSGMESAISEYVSEVNDFISYFEKHPGTTLTNPFFGELNFQEWITLLHKHAVHHCKQFGLL